MLTLEMFKQQLAEDPNREYFDVSFVVCIRSEFNKDKNSNHLYARKDKITRMYFDRYLLLLGGDIPLICCSEWEKETLLQRIKSIDKMQAIKSMTKIHHKRKAIVSK